jgi:uncharacterized protein YjbJ (UPF0337 family)
MNWDRIEGNWKQFKGSVKERWGKLTDDELDVIAGKRDKLAGRIQASYGVSKDAAEQQLTHWQSLQVEAAAVAAAAVPPPAHAVDGAVSAAHAKS